MKWKCNIASADTEMQIYEIVTLRESFPIFHSWYFFNSNLIARYIVKF